METARRGRFPRYIVGAVMAVVLATVAPVAGSADTQAMTSSLQERAMDLARANGAIDDQGLIVSGSKVDGIPTEEYIDIAGIADSQGLSMRESIARYQHVSSYMDFRDSLAVSYPTSMGTAKRTSDSSWHISFKGEIPKEATELAASLPFDVTFDSEAPYAREELLGLANELSLTYKDSLVEIDEETHLLVVVSPHQEISRESLSSPLPGIEIEFVHDASVNPGAGAEDARLRGGAEIRAVAGSSDTGQQTATSMSSFTLVSPTTGAIRMGTCAHCRHLINNNQPNSCGTAKTPVTYRLWPIDGSTVSSLNVLNSGPCAGGVDLAVLSHAGRTPTSEFYWLPSQKRTATARQGVAPQIGDPSCHYRRNLYAEPNPGVNCGEVSTIFSSGGQHRIRMTERFSNNGDSGGPWYWGGRAMGAHRGHSSGGSDWTPVYVYLNLWGYHVRL